MKFDYDRQKEKETEVLKDIENILREAGFGEGAIRIIAQELMTTAVRITPPEKEPIVMDLVTLNTSGRGGGRSTKPGNIFLNIGSLIDAVSSGVFTFAALTQMPWAAPLALLLLWNNMWRSCQVRLSEAEAVTLWVMWEGRDPKNRVKLEDIKPAADTHADKYQRPKMSEKDIEHALENLRSIGCIDLVDPESNTWWLREWIAPSYR